MGAHEVVQVKGLVSYEVSTDRGLIWHCQIDKLRRRVLPDAEDSHNSTTTPDLATSLPEDEDLSSQSWEEEVSPDDNGIIPKAELLAVTPTTHSSPLNKAVPEIATHPTETSRPSEQGEGPCHSLQERQIPVYLRDFMHKVHKDLESTCTSVLDCLDVNEHLCGKQKLVTLIWSKHHARLSDGVLQGESLPPMPKNQTSFANGSF